MLEVIDAIIKLILWLVAIPLCIGVLFNGILPLVRRTIGITMILGYLIYFAVFEVIAIPCMLHFVYNAFSYCCRYSMWAFTIMAALGVLKSVQMLKHHGMSYLSLFPGETHATAHELLSPRSDPRMLRMNYSLESKIYWGIFFALLLFQMVMAVVMSSFDGDDAYYVVESLLAQQADVMNTILPYVGTTTYLDIRHALAVITMWIAFVAKLSGIHATIVSHSIIPLFFIPLVYLVYVEIGRILFRSRQQIIPVFMIVVSLLLMFGNVSIYTPATFFLMRTWQGKALVSNLVFPMILWLFLWMFENSKMEERTSFRPAWIMLGLVNMLSGVCSSLGVIFGSGLIALLTLVLLVVTKRWTVILGAFLCIIPNIIYLGIYFSVWSRV
jgi:hypothetical protein